MIVSQRGLYRLGSTALQEMQRGLETNSREYLDERTRHAADRVDQWLTEAEQDLTTLAGTAQALVDGGESPFSTAADSPDARSAHEPLTWHAERRFSQNAPGSPSVVFVPAHLSRADGTILPGALRAIAFSARIAPLMQVMQEEHPAQLHVYYIGPPGAGITRLVPWTDLGGEVLRENPEFTDTPYWSYYPEIVRLWEEWLAGTPRDSDVVWPHPTPDYATGRMIQEMIHPVWTRERDGIAGGIWVDLDLSSVNRFVDELRLFQTGFALIALGDGNVLAAGADGAARLGLLPREVRVGRGEQSLRLLRESREPDVAALPLPRDAEPVLRRIVLGNEPYWISLQRLRSLNTYGLEPAGIRPARWLIGLAVPEGELFAALGRTRERFDKAAGAILAGQVTVAVGTLVLVVAIATLLTGRMTTQVGGLARAARRLAEGDLAARVPVVSDDEFGGIAESFNIMADRIEGTVGALRDRNRALHESQSRYREIATNIPGMVYVLERRPDESLQFTYVSESVTGLIGYTPSEIMDDARCLFDRIPPEDMECVRRKAETSRIRLQPYSHVHRLLHRDGGVRWVSTSATPHANASGGIYWNGVVIDITATKKAEAALREALLSQEIAVRSGGVGLWDWDLATNRVRYSDEYKRQIGQAPDEVGDDFEEWRSRCHPADLEPTLRKVRRYIAEGRESFEVEYRFRHSDGHYLWILARGSVLAGEDGRPQRVMGSHIDITEQKRLLAEIEREKERAEMYLGIAASIILALDPDGNITLLNEDGGRILECDPAEAIGRNWFDTFLPERVRTDVRDIFRRLMQGEEEPLRYVEGPAVTAKGREILIRWHNSLTRAPDGTILGTIASGEDITERKAAEAALRESEERFRGVAETVPLGIQEVDTEGRITYVNPAYARIFGYTPEETIGSFIWDRIPNPEGFEAFFRHLVRDQPKPEPWFGKNRTSSGDTLDIRVDWDYRRDAKGRLRGFVAILANRTEQLRLEEQLRHSQKMEAIGQLAGGVAHDFNNQLAGIMGYADLLLQRLDEPTQKRYAASILASTSRASDLTAQLLAFARRGQFQSARVDIHQAIREVVDILRHSIDRRIEIQLSLDASAAATRGDPGQIHSMLLNLALNARDAMPEGGTLLFATAVRQVEPAEADTLPFDIRPGEYLRVEIRDSGCGMDTATRERIFEPFFTTKEPGKGTGMGLAAVYGTVKHHNGAIEVQSREGAGTSVRIWLPLAAETPAPLESPEPGRQTLARAEHEARILVVDDEAVVRNLAADILASLGYAVEAVANGEEALIVFGDDPGAIDLVLLDLIMPRLSGADTFRALRRIDPDARVLLSSGYSIDGTAQTLLNEGARGFIQKPFRPADLASAVAETLGHQSRTGDVPAGTAGD